MNNTLATTLLWVTCCLIWPVAHAERADRDKNLVFLADQARSDELNQTHVLAGNVTITKGTITVRGERVEVRDDAQGYQHVSILPLPGKRAFFRQKREGLDEYYEGEAQAIEYNGQTNQVKLVGNAELRRLRGAVVTDSSTGALISYDNNADVFSIDGRAAPAGRTGVGGQAKGVLATKNAANMPNGSEATPAPALRSSTSLSGDKK
jgi:lipopolysaccharide export system protein LptA